MPNKIHTRHNPESPLVGLFATRSPDRPNSVAKTTVCLLERRANILKVKGLDAYDGTSVIDIKPYLPGYDSVDNAIIRIGRKVIAREEQHNSAEAAGYL